MAKQEHFDVLKQGVQVWNQWRQEHLGIRPQLSYAQLSYASLTGANLTDANLDGANLSHANLSDTNLHNATLSRANLRNTDLRDVRLIKADLSFADLSFADLRHAHMFCVNLSNTDLIYANLMGADLRRANLHYADLREANLHYADLRGANLSRANLYNPNLSETNLSGATVSQTYFIQVDLQRTKGLVEVNYQGPSHVELYTAKLPQDGSALHFLRGVGISDEWIDFYRAQMMSPIQYYSCFISYSSKDEVLAKRLHADLQDQGVRCWFAPEDMKIGDKIRARIDEAIHLQDKLLLLLSKHALASSWVEDEVEAALEKEQRQQREVLFPVRLDEHVMQTGTAWAAKLHRTRHIGDFTRWTDPQVYQQAFERLLRDLKAQS
ncbi:hypothetical protein KSF_015610 [Reticulibacter mediterranei]|uniref:TIR domain-containing protein n=1 Tax=Reticulibacter mediterranei TaxID=2778369 RepID=A0A8J3IFH7_9CHLR|nr:toll/interleukin-1 receptor domain-containing protein [Reticulibacter mediterranei]GHO91513.1 hypothetical protein KSF_015610 [Reticulibacter mediterranei]